MSQAVIEPVLVSSDSHIYIQTKTYAILSTLQSHRREQEKRAKDEFVSASIGVDCEE